MGIKLQPRLGVGRDRSRRLASIDRDAEAREALQHYLALPSSGPLKTIAAWKAYNKSKVSEQHGDPRFFEINERTDDGLRKAGMPEE